MNRIEIAINKMNDKLSTLNQNQLNNLKVSFNDIDDLELIEYQKTQSLAFASNLLTLEEANLVYNIIGREHPCVEKFNNRTLAEKIVITKLMHELITSLRL